MGSVQLLWYKQGLTPVSLEKPWSLIDRASWRTANHATTKKMVKITREIEDIARRKFPSTKWTGD